MNDKRNLEPIDDEIGVVRDLRRKKKPLRLKTIGFGILVVLLVVSSFWVSFFIGKSLLAPAKRLPEMDFEKLDAQFEEARAALESVTGEASVMPTVESAPVKETAEKKPAVAEPAKAPEVKKEVVKKDLFYPPKKTVAKTAAIPAVKPKAASVTSSSVKLFRVQTPLLDGKDKTVDIMKNLEGAGFEVYARDEGSGKFTIQMGAFKKRSNAENLLDQLKSKGFSGEIIEE